MHTTAVPAPLDSYWPVYFASRDITLRNLEVKAGELFPVQRKSTVRDFLRSFHPTNIDRLPLSELKMLKTLYVPERVYSEIIEKHANYEQAVAILRRRMKG
jgi:hypothetical protein